MNFKIPKIVFSDFDGTLTNHHGHIDHRLHDVVELCRNIGAKLVILSGRSVSWGHFFLTHLPVDAAILEGGGVIVAKNEKGLLEEWVQISDEEIIDLHEFSIRMGKEPFRQYVSLDSYGRKTDQAMEYYHMPQELQIELIKMLAESGLSYAISSVHLNYWSGEVSKAKAAKKFLQQFYPSYTENDCLFFGDAKNDESMFEHFPYTVGVSNISKCIDKLNYRPQFVLSGEEFGYVQGVLKTLQQILHSTKGAES